MQVLRDRGNMKWTAMMLPEHVKMLKEWGEEEQAAAMISREDRHAVHEFIVLDLAVRSLQYDYVMLETLKMKKFYIRIIEPVLKELQKDYYNRKRLLAKKNIRVVRWTKIDQYFSDVVIATAGEDAVLRYAGNALKMEVEQLILEKAALL